MARALAAMLAEAERLDVPVTAGQVEALLVQAAAHLLAREAPPPVRGKVHRVSSRLVPAGRTHAAVRSMAAAGWPLQVQMREAGVNENAAFLILRQAWVYVATEALVVAAAERLLGVDPVARGVRRGLVARTAARARVDGWSVDEFRLLAREADGVVEGEVMTEQQQAEAQCAAVAELKYCGDPDQDHLLDAMQHPETEEALYEMPFRPAAA
jgi:hypothetical protein